MKKLFLTFIALLFIFPIAVGAHTNSTENTFGPGYMMMQNIEDEVLGDELHEEMESLMIKMMQGTLTDTEEGRLIELMQEYPGPHGMMMGRLAYSDCCDGDGWFSQNRFGGMMMGPGMMDAFGGGLVIFWWITSILIWAILILVIIALVKWVRKK